MTPDSLLSQTATHAATATESAVAGYPNPLAEYVIDLAHSSAATDNRAHPGRYTESPLQMIGGKARALALLNESCRQLNIHVPRWFVLTPKAFFDSINITELNALISQGDEAAFDAWFENISICEMAQAALRQAVQHHGFESARLAVRSSARLEDSHQVSFAGIYHSELNVSIENLHDSIKQVWRAAFRQRVLDYSQIHHIPTHMLVPAVLVQKLVDPDVSGIAFTADPIKNRVDRQLIAAAYGLGLGVASGEMDADLITLGPLEEVLDYNVAHKGTAHHCNGQEVVACPVEASLADRPALSQKQARYLGRVFKRIEAHFGTPQDIEWALKDGTLYILQSRPITAFDKVKTVTFWHNEGVDEMWPGVIGPATFDLIRRAYAIGYDRFFRFCGASPAHLEAIAPIRGKLLGLIQGRLYWNQSHLDVLWQYRPPFTAIQSWLHAHSQHPHHQHPGVAGQPVPSMVGFCAGLLNGFQLLHRLKGACTQTFHALSQKSRTMPPNPNRLNAHQLAFNIESTMDCLFHHWHVSIMVNYTTSIWFDALQWACSRWVDTEGAKPNLASDLLCANPQRPSHQQTRALQALAQTVSTMPKVMAAFRHKSGKTAMAAMYEHPALAQQFERYMHQYGTCGDDSYIIERGSLAEDPTPLLRSIGEWAFTMAWSKVGDDAHAHTDTEPDRGMAELAEKAGADMGAAVLGLPKGVQIRQEAEATVQWKLQHKPIEQWLFQTILGQARYWLSQKEHLHRANARLLTQLRWYALALGYHLQQADALVYAEDVMMLTFPEMIGYVHGTAVDTALKQLVRQRNNAYKSYERAPAPDPMFETAGMVYDPEQQYTMSPMTPVAAYGHCQGEEEGDGLALTGQGCFPGKLEGTIRIVDNPNDLRPEPGDILLVRQGHPGLIHLFPAASGLIMEYGSPLSHVSILARELELPTLVGVKHATQALHDGDRVELDSHRGTVRRLD
ncbi:MAG: hypothetical protein KC474_04695 [Cyanobacteria bacterium HKST-UBA04]|nr:hypothetical protein [Cyanobacteria bacterium HKST-UBA04]